MLRSSGSQQSRAHICSTSSSCFNASGTAFLTASPLGLRAVALEKPKEAVARASSPSAATTSSSSWAQPHDPSLMLCQRPQVEAAPGVRGSDVLAVAAAGDSPVVAVLLQSGARAAEAPESLTAKNSEVPVARTETSDSRRHLYLFDARTDTFLAELYFRGAIVCALHANRHVLVVSMPEYFCLVELRTLRLLKQQSTHNQLGCLALAQRPALTEGGVESGGGQLHVYRLAFPQPARGKGDVCVLSVGVRDGNATAPTQPPRLSSPPGCTTWQAHEGVRQTCLAAAHTHRVAALCFSADGNLLASASDLGSTVKLLDGATGVLLMEYQRGYRRARILALGIDHSSCTLAALSSTGTLHLFACDAAHLGARRGRAGGRYHLGVPGEKQRASAKKTVRPPVQRNREDTEKARADGGAAVSSALVEEGWCYHVAFAPDDTQVWVGASNRCGTRTGGDNGLESDNLRCATRRGPTVLVGQLQRFSMSEVRSMQADGPEEVYDICI